MLKKDTAESQNLLASNKFLSRTIKPGIHSTPVADLDQGDSQRVTQLHQLWGPHLMEVKYMIIAKKMIFFFF